MGSLVEKWNKRLKGGEGKEESCAKGRLKLRGRETKAVWPDSCMICLEGGLMMKLTTSPKD